MTDTVICCCHCARRLEPGDAWLCKSCQREHDALIAARKAAGLPVVESRPRPPIEPDALANELIGAVLVERSEAQEGLAGRTANPGDAAGQSPPASPAAPASPLPWLRRFDCGNCGAVLYSTEGGLGGTTEQYAHDLTMQHGHRHWGSRQATDAEKRAWLQQQPAGATS